MKKKRRMRKRRIEGEKKNSLAFRCYLDTEIVKEKEKEEDEEEEEDQALMILKLKKREPF